MNDLDLFVGRYDTGRAPVEFKIVKTGRALDALASTSVGIRLASPRLIRCLSDEQISGWSTYPVSVRNDKTRALADFVGLSIVGQSGPFKADASLLLHGWDGNDIFAPANSYLTCITPRAQAALAKHSISGLELQTPAAVAADFFAYGGG